MSTQTTQPDWETFVRSPDALQEGADIALIIRSLSPGRRKYQMRHVVARISRHPGSLPGGETLWVRTTVGVRLEQPWTIKILYDLPLELPGRPYRDVFEALRNTPHGT